MKKTFLILAVGIAAVTLAFGTNAYAFVVPTIDGMLTVADEWAIDELHTSATDINEGGIPDSRDIWRLLVKNADLGAASDGLYFRVDTFDTPTLTGGPDSGGVETFTRIFIDFDGDLVADRGIDFNDAFDPGTGTLGVYNGTFTTKFGEGDGDVDESAGGFYEFYLPESLYGAGNSVSSTTGFRVRLDDSGSNEDDFLPNSGFTTAIPEPGTLLLLGSGLFGLLGVGGLRFKN